MAFPATTLAVLPRRTARGWAKNHDEDVQSARSVTVVMLDAAVMAFAVVSYVAAVMPVTAGHDSVDKSRLS